MENYKNKFAIKDVEKKIKYHGWEFDDLPVFSMEDKGDNNIYTFLKDYESYVQIETSDKFINAYKQHFFGVARLIFINHQSKVDYFLKNIKFDFFFIFLFLNIFQIYLKIHHLKKGLSYLIFIRALRKFFYTNKYSNLIFKKKHLNILQKNQ